MEIVEMNIESMVKVNKALNRILSLPGIQRGKVYWLERVRKSLMKHITVWYTENMKNLFEEFAIDIPQTPLVPAQDYPSFKRELTNCLEQASSVEELRTWVSDLFPKYEVLIGETKGVPPERMKEYTRKVGQEGAKYNETIEFATVELDPAIERVLQQLPGEDQLVVDFLFKEPSPIKLAPANAIH